MSTSQQPFRLYAFSLSGHSHRVELMLSLLGLPFERHEVDLTKGGQKTEGFLAKNPWGQVPVLEQGELVLYDSNAILVYLALRYDERGAWLPRDPLAAARVQQWLSIAAGQLAHGPALLRAAALFGLTIDETRPRQLAAQLLHVLDGELAKRPFLASEHATIADVALYSYVARAPEGGVSLASHAKVSAWLERVQALPGFVPMPATRTHHNVERTQQT